MKSRTLTVLFLFSCALAASAQERPRIAIQTFENPANFHRSTIGNALTEIVTTEIGKTGRYRVLERSAVESLMKEIEFGESDWAKPQAFAQRGGMLGADYFLLGKVTNFSFVEKVGQRRVRDRRGTRMVRVYQQQADVRVDFRLVSTASGEAVLTESGAGSATAQGASSLMPFWNRFVATAVISSEFSGSLIGRATEEAIQNLVRKLTDLSSQVTDHTMTASLESVMGGLSAVEGKIMGAAGPQHYIVSVGAQHGLVRGEHLTLMRENVTKNKRGEIIYREQQEVGTLEVVDISMQDRARARLVSSEAEPREGDTVRVNLDHATTLRGGGSPAGGGSPGGGNSELDAFLARGDRYMEDAYFVQALEQYQRAESLSPDDPAILARLAVARALTRDFLQAESTADRVLGMGETLRLPAAHNHFMGYCTGELRITQGRVSYHPSSGDHGFEAETGSVVSITTGSIQQYTVPMLVVRYRDPGGRERKYDLLLNAFLKATPGQPDLRRTFVASGSEAEDTDRLNRIVLRLTEKHLN